MSQYWYLVKLAKYRIIVCRFRSTILTYESITTPQMGTICPEKIKCSLTLSVCWSLFVIVEPFINCLFINATVRSSCYGVPTILHEYIGTTKISTFRTWRFQVHFHNRTILDFPKIIIEYCDYYQKHHCVGQWFGNVRPHTSVLSNVDPVPGRHMTSPCLSKLTRAVWEYNIWLSATSEKLVHYAHD